MKKYLSVFLVILMTALLFASCGKSQATKDVQELIKAVGDVSADSGEAISKAQAAYDKLSAEEKEDVKNYDKLEAAVAEYADITDFNDAIAEILTAAETSFSSDAFDISAMLKKYEELSAKYEEMNKDRRASVKDFDKLSAACEKLQGYVENAQKAAVQYLKAFLALNKGADVTAIGCVKQIRNETEYHFFALTYKNAEGGETSVYSTARFSGEAVYDTIIANPEIFFAAAPASEESNALLSGNVEIDLAAAKTAAAA